MVLQLLAHDGCLINDYNIIANSNNKNLLPCVSSEVYSYLELEAIKSRVGCPLDLRLSLHAH